MSLRIAFIVFAAMGMISNVYAYFPEGDYGIIKGTNVNMRAQSSVKAQKKKVLEDRELVIVIGKSESTDTIEKVTDYWYLIKTQSDEEGWVFGKFIDLYSKSEKYEEFSIINDILINVSNFDREGKYYINTLKRVDPVYYYIRHEEKHDHEILGFDSIYNKNRDKLEVVIFGRFNFESIYIDKEYVYLVDATHVRIFNSSKKNMLERRGRNVELYQYVVDKYVNKPVSTGSHLEFDPKTKTVTTYQRNDKTSEFTVERYIFKNEKFVKVE